MKQFNIICSNCNFIVKNTICNCLSPLEVGFYKNYSILELYNLRFNKNIYNITSYLTTNSVVVNGKGLDLSLNFDIMIFHNLTTNDLMQKIERYKYIL